MSESFISIGEILDRQMKSQITAATGKPPVAVSGSQGQPKEPPVVANAANPANHPKPSSMKMPIPKIPARDREDDRKRYFVDQGLLLYNSGENILLDRQVIPFCQLAGYRYERDMYYFKTHVLMESESGQRFRPVCEGRQPGYKWLSPVSNCMKVRPESCGGFLGQDSRIDSDVCYEDMAPFESFGDWSNFKDQSPKQVVNIMPCFYVPGGVSSNGGRQMVNPLTGKTGWYRPLHEHSPLVFPYPCGLRTREVVELETCLFQHFAFTEIFIGMAAAGLAEWRHVAPNILDSTHPYVARISRPVPLHTFGMTATELGIKVDAFFTPCDNRDNWSKLVHGKHSEELMNQPARRRLDFMMGRGLTLKPIVEMVD